MNKLKNLPLVQGTAVFLRVDFNVPIKDGIIQDTKRIDAALPTIRFLLEKKCKIIVATHLGKPSGKGYEKEFSTEPVFRKLGALLGAENVLFAGSVIGEETAKKVKELKSGQALMLENVRFHKEENKNDPGFSKELASYAEVYINDAFGTMHRAHASVDGVPRLFPMGKKGCGFLVEYELEYLRDKLKEPERPYTIIIGGAKVSDKIELLKNMTSKADNILIGGGMMFTFLKAKNINIGRSILEADKIPVALEILEHGGSRIKLPVDALAVDDIENPTYTERKAINELKENDIGVDIGTETAEQFAHAIEESKTVIFNGPMGIFEDDRYAAGTRRVIEAMKNSKGITIVGGGDSASAVKKFKMKDGITHISTGGGASLELLSGIELPGVNALES